MKKANLILRNSVGMVRYGWDDGYLLGKKKKVCSRPWRKSVDRCR